MNRSWLVFIVALVFLRLLDEFSSCDFQKFILHAVNCDHHYSLSLLNAMKRLFVLQILQLHITLFRFHCVSPNYFLLMYFCIQTSYFIFQMFFFKLLKFLDRNIYNINFICSARPGECRSAWQIFYGSQAGLRKLPDDKMSSNRNFSERNSIFPFALSLWQCLPPYRYNDTGASNSSDNFSSWWIFLLLAFDFLKTLSGCQIWIFKIWISRGDLLFTVLFTMPK